MASTSRTTRANASIATVPCVISAEMTHGTVAILAFARVVRDVDAIGIVVIAHDATALPLISSSMASNFSRTGAFDATSQQTVVQSQLALMACSSQQMMSFNISLRGEPSTRVSKM